MSRPRETFISQESPTAASVNAVIHGSGTSGPAAPRPRTPLSFAAVPRSQPLSGLATSCRPRRGQSAMNPPAGLRHSAAPAGDDPDVPLPDVREPILGRNSLSSVPPDVGPPLALSRNTRPWPFSLRGTL